MIAGSRRRGSILAIVGGLIILMAAAAFMLQRAILQQHLDAHRYTFGEIALYMAESGLNLSIEHLRESALTPGTKFYALLLETSADEINRISEPIQSPHLDALAAFLGNGASLEVSVEFENFRPLHPADSLRGVLGDPREKFGDLAVVSRATYRGVTRTLVAAKQVKVVSVVAPVVSKFTLFLLEQGDQDPNLLTYDRLDPRSGPKFEGEPASPLVLYHRPEQTPAIAEGRFFPLADVLPKGGPDSGGLVFLGGGRPWFLNLVHGAGSGPHEELYHLRRTRMVSPSKIPGIKNECGIFFGFYDGILRSPKFGRGAGKPGGLVRPVTGEPVTDRTAALHLYGDVFNASPTVVLGPVFRSYVTLRLLDGLWYPYLAPGEFPPPDTRLPPFPAGYDSYRNVMVRVEAEPYNRSWDYIATNREALEGEGQVAAPDTPLTPAPLLATQPLERVRPAVEGDTGFLYPALDRPAPGVCALQRREGNGSATLLFRGALQDVDGPLMEKILMAKATFLVPRASDVLARFKKGANLEVPGVVYAKDGDLELEECNVGQGAMIVVEGNITIRGKIVQTRKNHPLTLVSLDGDIAVETDEKVDAHLIALRGRVQSRGKLDLVGGIAARGLDFASLVVGPEPKSVSFNPDLDPTQPEAAASHLRVVVDRQVKVYLEGH